jgi:hypothetical protein
MRWYYAESADAERWKYGGDSKEAATAEALGDCWGEYFFVAPECEGQGDTEFWSAVASAIAWHFESIDEALSEDGWIDFEDGWLEVDPKAKELERKLAEWLPTVLERPDWRTVDIAKAERIDPEEIASARPGSGQ